MKQKITKEVLDVFFKYDEDLSLLNERWAKEEDRDKVSFEQSVILGRYIENLEFLKISNVSSKLRDNVYKELLELESHINQDVIDLLKKKYLVM